MARKKNRRDNRGKPRSDATNGTNSLELRNHLECLPQELYNYIYDLTFTADAKVRLYARKYEIKYLELDHLQKTFSERAVTINEPPPDLLHVNRHSRTKFASSYFGQESIFVIVGPARWDICFQRSHLQLIRVPRYMAISGCRFPYNNPPGSRFIFGYEASSEAYADRLVLASMDEIVELVKQYAGAME
ncbi:hypothetical protein CBER1_10124 [Cercospora berteroae]|uniref:Uncharacterized protein n=1 Tax=Cercospora berteroae TaxID=357750 RepID=A0A2S6CKE9_9PEZI|nr:hypothetical protein CBER1_10124 [Cercospora berteroae]